MGNHERKTASKQDKFSKQAQNDTKLFRRLALGWTRREKIDVAEMKFSVKIKAKIPQVVTF